MEYIVKKIRPAREDGFLVVYIAPAGSPEEQERLVLSERAYREGGAPLVGEVIMQEVYDGFVYSEKSREALRCALRLLGYSDKSERALTDELVRRGYEREIAREACEECVRLGYLKESRALLRLVEELANRKLRGARRIQAELAAKGYAPSAIRETLCALLSSGEINFEESFKALLRKKGVDKIESPIERKQKIQKLAYQYGFK